MVSYQVCWLRCIFELVQLWNAVCVGGAVCNNISVARSKVCKQLKRMSKSTIFWLFSKILDLSTLMVLHTVPPTNFRADLNQKDFEVNNPVSKQPQPHRQSAPARIFKIQQPQLLYRLSIARHLIKWITHRCFKFHWRKLQFQQTQMKCKKIYIHIWYFI